MPNENLRQKTWAVFIRPYEQMGGDRVVQRGTVYLRSACQPQTGVTAYTTARDGDCWMLYKGQYLTSYGKVRELVKEVMDTLGYSRDDIHVAEIAPIDHYITPAV